MVLALPASAITVPGYYVVYGLLALVPGANPDSNSGYSSCLAHVGCRVSSSGDLVEWLLVATVIAGVFALSAAYLNAVLLRAAITARRRGRQAPMPTGGRLKG